MHESCISQGTVVTFFRCGGQVHNHLRLIYSGFCLAKKLFNLVGFCGVWFRFLSSLQALIHAS